MNETWKDKLAEQCDANDWRLSFNSRGCKVRTAGGVDVEYLIDSSDRTVTIRADGPRKGVMRVLSEIDKALGPGSVADG